MSFDDQWKIKSLLRVILTLFFGERVRLLTVWVRRQVQDRNNRGCDPSRGRYTLDVL